MIQWSRTTVRKLFLRAGLDVRLGNRWGLDRMEDLARVLGDQANTILDAGANRGQAALQFSSKFSAATIYSFEPIPDAVTELRVLAKKVDRLRIIPCALGSAEGEMTLNVTVASEGSSLLPLAVAPGQFGSWTIPAEQIVVPVKRLDLALAELNVTRADLLKIDTQGFDLEVLKGAGDMLTPGTIRAVMVEVSFQPFYEGQPRPHEVIAYLDARGYRPVAMHEGGREPGGRLYWADMIFA